MRIVSKITGTTTDISNELNDYFNGTSTVVLTTSDYIYIGQKLPFNCLYVKPSTANTNSSVLSIYLWDGTQWRAVADKHDGTSSGGKTFAQAGFVEFTPEKINPWTREDTVDTEGNELVSGLGGIKIFDLYWIRLSVSATLSAGTALSYVGMMFSNDTDLGVEFPDLVLTATKTAYSSGRTAWEDVNIKAAEMIERDLQKKNVVYTSGQLLDRKELLLPSVQKVAEIIFNAMGDDYVDNRNDARKEYLARLENAVYTIDTNADGIASVEEKFLKQGWFSR